MAACCAAFVKDRWQIRDGFVTLQFENSHGGHSAVIVMSQ
jgi:hypothetical protein